MDGVNPDYLIVTPCGGAGLVELQHWEVYSELPILLGGISPKPEWKRQVRALDLLRRAGPAGAVGRHGSALDLLEADYEKAGKRQAHTAGRQRAGCALHAWTNCTRTARSWETSTNIVEGGWRSQAGTDRPSATAFLQVEV